MTEHERLLRYWMPTWETWECFHLIIARHITKSVVNALDIYVYVYIGSSCLIDKRIMYEKCYIVLIEFI